MEQNTLIKMETFIANVLRNSPLISGDINVVTLADTQDEEGIVQMARSITVRYTDSSSTVFRKSPMVLARSINFELIHASQSYLTRQAHEMVLEACTGAYMALTSQVPCNTGVNVLKGLHLSSERFQGISESKHYVYVQKWEMLVNEQYQPVAYDPAVTMGHCKRLFAQKFVSVVEEGEFVWNGKIYEPVYHGLNNKGDYDPNHSGVRVIGDDLVFANLPEDYANRSVVFVKNYKDARFSSAGLFDDKGGLIVHIAEQSGVRKTNIYINKNEKSVLQVATSLFEGGDNGNRKVGKTMLLTQRRGYAYVKSWRTTLCVDPEKENAATVGAKYGDLLTLEAGVELTIKGTRWLRVGEISVGKAWVKADDVVFCDGQPDREPIAQFLGYENPQPQP